MRPVVCTSSCLLCLSFPSQLAASTFLVADFADCNTDRVLECLFRLYFSSQLAASIFLAAAFADRSTGRVLEEMRQALLASCSNQLPQLLANRRDEGTLESTSGEVAAAATAALEALRPEKDDLGGEGALAGAVAIGPKNLQL